jgi:hypothetical protein
MPASGGEERDDEEGSGSRHWASAETHVREALF